MSYQREYERKLKIGLVGAGSHAYRNLLPAFTYLPVELKAICDIDEDLARKTAIQYGAEGVYTSAEAMYKNEDLDAVFLALPPHLNPEMTIGAFDAGLHVWMEKPPAIRATQVEEMLRHRGDRVCVVGFKKAFMPCTEKVVEIVGNSEFGSLKSMIAMYPLKMPLEGKKLLDEGVYWNNLCHPLALMLRVGGDISAVTTYRAKVAGGCIVFEFQNGAIGNLHMTSGVAAGQPHENYFFYGDGMHIEIRNSSKVTCYRSIPFKYGITTSYAPPGMDHGAISWEPQNTVATLENKTLFTQGFWNEMKYFCDCVLESREASICSLEFALHLVQVHEAALLSEGNRVIPETT